MEVRARGGSLRRARLQELIRRGEEKTCNSNSKGNGEALRMREIDCSAEQFWSRT